MKKPSKKKKQKKAPPPTKRKAVVKAKAIERTIARFGVEVPKKLNGFDPTLYAVTLRAEQIEGEEGWHFHTTIAELPDAAVYEDTPSAAYGAAMETIMALYEAAQDSKQPFPKPGTIPLNPLVADLRKAFEFYEQAKADPKGDEVGAIRDGHEWVLKAARALADA